MFAFLSDCHDTTHNHFVSIPNIRSIRGSCDWSTGVRSPVRAEYFYSSLMTSGYRDSFAGGKALEELNLMGLDQLTIIFRIRRSERSKSVVARRSWRSPGGRSVGRRQMPFHLELLGRLINSFLLHGLDGLRSKLWCHETRGITNRVTTFWLHNFPVVLPNFSNNVRIVEDFVWKIRTSSENLSVGGGEDCRRLGTIWGLLWTREWTFRCHKRSSPSTDPRPAMKPINTWGSFPRGKAAGALLSSPTSSG